MNVFMRALAGIIVAGAITVAPASAQITGQPANGYLTAPGVPAQTMPEPLREIGFDQKIDEHFGYEAKDDVAGVLATLAAGATHDIVGYPTGPTQDRQAIRAFYENLFTDLSEGQAKPLRRLYGDNFMVDESLWEGRAPGRPFGIEGHNRPLSFRLLHVSNGRALIEDGSGMYMVRIGSTMPDNTQLTKIEQRDGEWLIETSSGRTYYPGE